VRVPDQAGSGMARVTLSYPRWKGRPVAPATFAVPIKDVGAAPKRPGGK
jgi:hypothetical protein